MREDYIEEMEEMDKHIEGLTRTLKRKKEEKFLLLTEVLTSTVKRKKEEEKEKLKKVGVCKFCGCKLECWGNFEEVSLFYNRKEWQVHVRGRCLCGGLYHCQRTRHQNITYDTFLPSSFFEEEEKENE